MTACQRTRSSPDTSAAAIASASTPSARASSPPRAAPGRGPEEARHAAARRAGAGRPSDRGDSPRPVCRDARTRGRPPMRAWQRPARRAPGRSWWRARAPIGSGTPARGGSRRSPRARAGAHRCCARARLRTARGAASAAPSEWPRRPRPGSGGAGSGAPPSPGSWRVPGERAPCERGRRRDRRIPPSGVRDRL